MPKAFVGLKKFLFKQYDIFYYNTIEEFRMYLHTRVSKAKESIYIVSGEISESLNHPVIGNAMKMAMQRGVRIEIFSGLTDIDKNHSFSKLKESELFTHYILKNRPIRHFIVIDSSFICIENAHQPLISKDRMGYFFYSPKVGLNIEKKMDILRNPDNLIENNQ